jgi:branched-chain amino acid transport system substrate-binding protein
VQTPLGNLQWGKGPVANVVVTPIIGGQWLAAAAGSKYKLDFVLCENSCDNSVPVAAKLRPYGT